LPPLDEAVPVPASATDCGLAAALSLKRSAPVRFPVAVGVKVTLIVQLPPAASELPQLLVWAKSPLAEICVSERLAAPLLVSVMLSGELVEFTT
jgi:hypothetical protein